MGDFCNSVIIVIGDFCSRDSFLFFEILISHEKFILKVTMYS